MNKELMPADRVLRAEATRHLRDIPNIRVGLQFFRENLTMLSDRIAEFDAVLTRIMRQDIFRCSDPDFYRHAIALRHIPGGIALPRLANIARMAQSSYIRNNQLIANSIETVKDVEGLIRSREWSFSSEDIAPGQLASGLIIEGYGLLLEKYLERKGLARTFVLAFEEVLLKDFPNSQLLKDILPWVIKEKDDFPPRVRNEIEDLVTL